MFYGSRALEWVNVRKLFQELLVLFHFAHLCPVVDDITIAWSYGDNLSSVVYRPSLVFKTFSFVDLLNKDQQCACRSARRLLNFCDPSTLNETSSFAKIQLHVRTTDLSLIQHNGLRNALAQGLNHIPVRPTNIAEAVAIIMDAFEQLSCILQLESLQFPLHEARTWLHDKCLMTLKAASRCNKFGFKETDMFLLDKPVVRNELAWLQKHLYCSGLDKASNNASFICIKHIRLQALERLNGNDFSPCKNSTGWCLPTAVLDHLSTKLTEILPECPQPYQALPYIMATYKVHKTKYRWLTNAYCTIFSHIASLLTITAMLVLESFKSWAHSSEQGYQSFLNARTSMFWMVDSVIDTALNFPKVLNDIFVADVTRCYESIPLEGPNNLLEAITYISNIAFKQAALTHPRAKCTLWIKVKQDGTPIKAQWSTRQPSSGTWFELSKQRLLNLHAWLMTNCHVCLGDRVWIQKTGIPMGFSCSPIWCNIYLCAYEAHLAQFIQRLANLGRRDLLLKFQSAFRYIDDLCLLNVSNPHDFLSAKQPRSHDNPYWIYPLNVLEIKEETASFDPNNPCKGIQAHFMNMEITVNDNDPNLFSLRKFDKRRALPFQYTQYIKFKSNRCVRQAYNIAISQVLPILYITTSVMDASREILILIDTMTNNGFNRRCLVNNITQFMSNGSFPGTRLNIQEVVSAISR
jgi:hypothetical protein